LIFSLGHEHVLSRMEFFEDDEADWGNRMSLSLLSHSHLSAHTSAAFHHMIAGALAGTAEHCSLYPLDVVK
jgi:hypothetical protein